MSDFEQQWAVALQKTRLKSKQPATEPKIAIKQIQEELGHFKTQLKLAIQQKDQEKIARCLKKLIRLRARLAILKIKKEKNTLGLALEINTKSTLKQYYLDCQKLILAVKKLTKN